MERHAPGPDLPGDFAPADFGPVTEDVGIPSTVTRRTRAGRLLVVAIRTRRGVRARILTPGPYRLRLRSSHRRVRLLVTFRDREGTTVGARVAVG